MANKSADSRWLALQSLLLVLDKGRSLDDALHQVQDKYALADGRDLALSRELAHGVCRWLIALQEILKPYLRKSFKPKDRDLEIILVIGLYQLLLMRIDDHAAVNETVKLAQYQNKGWARGLVNGVLRQVLRDEIAIKPEHAALSHPSWMRAILARDWPQEHEQILAAGNERAPMTLRVDLHQRSREQQLERLQVQGISAQGHALIDSAIVLDKPCAVSLLDGFDDGILSVQDAAAQLAAVLLACEPGMRVLDACAAPGGKTAHILQHTANLDLVALDQDPERLTLIEQNLQRINRGARLICGDAALAGAWYEGIQFDRILADLPCSASGVIRRHPDIKLLRRASDIAQLVETQKLILGVLWPMLKPGGLLVYSTCSIFQDENERQVASFVENHDNCTVKEANSVQWGQQRPYGRQILPGQQDMDGFYYACLRKTATDQARGD